MDEKTRTPTSKSGEKPKGEGKLGMIEDQLEDIVADVKGNLNALFSRGEQFDELQSKSENLKEHVSRNHFCSFFSFNHSNTDLHLNCSHR